MFDSDQSASDACRLCFRGYARVALDDLTFPDADNLLHRPVSTSNVDRLLHIFRLEGCRRDDINNVVDGIIDETSLTTSLLSQNATLPDQHLGSDGKIPWLSCSVQCLTGLHRIHAADIFLDSNDKWWIVRLFTKEYPCEAHVRSAEAFQNEGAFADGYIFWKIRKYRSLHDEDAEARWWSRLSETKRKDLKQLLKNSNFAEAFDAMLQWPSLWLPVKLGSLHRLLTLKCPEELTNYLQYIVRAWGRICHNVDPTILPQIVDETTVQQLQGLVPGSSQSDAATVKALMQNWTLFTFTQSTVVREQLLANLTSFDGMIPSLYTFFEDLKYLEPAAKIIRKLLPPGEKRSLRSSLSAHYFAPECNTLECPEGQFQNLLLHESTFESGYHQLWLFALRNFPEMINMSPRKEPTRSKPLIVEPSLSTWRRLGLLAAQLGFKTAMVESFCAATDQESSVRVVEHLGYDAAHNHSVVTDLTEVLSRLRRTPPAFSAPSFVSDAELSLERRCGRPFEGDHYKDKNHLFLPSIYNKDVETGHDITTMFCKRHMVRTFLGIAENINFQLQPISLEAQVDSSYDESPYQCACSDLATIQDTAKRELVAHATEMANAIRTVAIKDSEILALREELGQVQSLALQHRCIPTSYVADREQLIKYYELQMSESSTNYNLLHSKLETFRGSNNNLLIELERLQKEHEQMKASAQERISGVELENDRFRNEHNALDSRGASLEIVVSDLQTRIAIANEQVESREITLADAARQIEIHPSKAEGDQRQLQLELESSKSACTDAAKSQRQLEQDLLDVRRESAAYLEEAEGKQRQLQIELEDSKRACTDATESQSQLAAQLSTQGELQRDLLQARQDASAYSKEAEAQSRIANDSENRHAEYRAAVKARAEELDRALLEISRLQERIRDLPTTNEEHAHTNKLAILDEQRTKPLDRIYKNIESDSTFAELRICHLVNNMVDERSVLVPDFWAEELVRAMELCHPTSLDTTAYFIGKPPKRVPPSQLEESEKSTRLQKEAFLKDHWIAHRTLTICPLGEVEAVVCQFNDPQTYHTRTVLGKRGAFNQYSQVPPKRKIFANRSGQ